MSLDRNFPGGRWETVLFDAYGVRPDPERIGFHRRRWNDEATPPG